MGGPHNEITTSCKEIGAVTTLFRLFRDDRLRSGGLAATLDGAGRELMRRSSGSCLPALGGLFDSPSFALFDTRRKNSAGAPLPEMTSPATSRRLPIQVPRTRPSLQPINKRLRSRRRSRLAVGIPAPQTGTRTCRANQRFFIRGA